MFILPNMLMSGFMFPIAGMPRWAQWVSELLPLTHYLRIVRGIMLKGMRIEALEIEALALVGLMLVVMTIAIMRFRKTLD
jgi:ABC-2 type transport system permease protein